MESIGLVFTTVGSEDQGIQIAESLVERGLVACVNIIKQVRSIYRWKGEIWDDEEYLLVMKTRTALFEKVKGAIKELHSYELPEVFYVDIKKSDPRVRGWIVDSTIGEEAE